MKKILLAFVYIFFLFFVSTNKANAQGTYDCKWISAGVAGICSPSNITCEPGYVYKSVYCPINKNKTDCENAPTKTCEKRTCANVKGSCKTSCETNESSSGTYDCPSGQTCCVSDVVQQVTSTNKKIICDDNKSIYTALGCLPVSDTTSFITFILQWAFGIGGGIAFLLIVLASFQIMTSGGDPKKLQAGKELLTSAITGLLLMVFSVFILKVIGVDILGLDDFGFGKTN